MHRTYICNLKKSQMKSLKLSNGAEMPVIGLGSYKGAPGEVEQSILDAIDIGYRHFDCAWFYGNEREIGNAFQEAFKLGKIQREDIFITSKLWNNFHDKKNVLPKLKESLCALQIDYIDLYLIHWPMGFKEDAEMTPKSSQGYSDLDYLETWEGMEECMRDGLARSIGLSNFNIKQVERVLSHCHVKPAVNQIEVNPNMNQKALRDYCRQEGIIVTAFCPLGRNFAAPTATGQPASTLQDPNVQQMSNKYKKTPAQIVLRYLINMGISVIPKSVNKGRLQENFNVMDFTLSDEDVAYLDSCNKNVRVSPMAAYTDHPHYPFERN